MIPSPSYDDKETDQNSLQSEVWRPFRFFNYYRILLAGVFVSAWFLNNFMPVMGNHEPALYFYTCLAYLFVGVLFSLLIHKRWYSFFTLAYSLVFIDIVALTLIMHASGGLKSGLGMLIIVAIAGNSLLIAGRTASLFAALAALAVLTDQVYMHLSGSLQFNYAQAGILGTALFATSLLARMIVGRLNETQDLAARRGVDLANLAQLNEHVIRRLQSGVVVVDANNYVHLINESAKNMLGLPVNSHHRNKQLDTASIELANCLYSWQDNISLEEPAFHNSTTDIDILPHFTRLGQDTASGTLIFLEDASRTAEQAKQIKLASLGRLTASIAHEIRNPLGAISHAEQLLAESSQLDKADRRLTEIIHNNSARVNGIIENVLQLGRKGNAVPEEIPLQQWLLAFIHEFAMSMNISPDELSCSVTPETAEVLFDNTQLHQIVWNLCQNGIYHSSDYPLSPKVEITVSTDDVTQRIFLEIKDHGAGIDRDTAEKVFEPFFTTSVSGSGLGLYIARELCEASRAHLSYYPAEQGGSCFRIEFTAQGHAIQAFAPSVPRQA